MQYISIKESLETPELGSYVSYGIAGFSSSAPDALPVIFISDVSTNAEFVFGLANLCTQEQVHPNHLWDVVYNAI